MPHIIQPKRVVQPLGGHHRARMTAALLLLCDVLLFAFASACTIRVRESVAVPTLGNAGFEVWNRFVAHPLQADHFFFFSRPRILIIDAGRALVSHPPPPQYFSLGGKHYLAAANFWDGKSHDMSALSQIFEVAATSGDKRSLQAESVQWFRTRGAHGWDFWSVGEHSFLVVPNYYFCTQIKTDCPGAASRESLLSRTLLCAHWSSCCCSYRIARTATVVYRYAPDADAEELFSVYQTLHTQGPAQTDHFCVPAALSGTAHESCYLVVGENFAGTVSVWRFVRNARAESRAGSVPSAASVRGRFEPAQQMAVPGAGAIAVELLDRSVILVAVSYNDRATGWRTKTHVYRWTFGSGPAANVAAAGASASASSAAGASAKRLRPEFKLVQHLDTHGAHDAEMIVHAGELFLFVSEDRDEQTSRIHSHLFVWSRGDERFVLVQALPTDGAHAAELFVVDGVLLLAVANFGDRIGKRYAAKSTVWVWSAARRQMTLGAELDSRGATDFEYFALPSPDGPRHFLALSNEGDLGGGAGGGGEPLHQTSFVYRVQLNGCATNDDQGAPRRVTVHSEL